MRGGGRGGGKTKPQHQTLLRVDIRKSQRAAQVTEFNDYRAQLYQKLELTMELTFGKGKRKQTAQFSIHNDYKV